MKYIKNFNKIYERYSDAIDDLVDQLSDDTIERYYDDNYECDIQVIVDMLGDRIFQFVDNDKYVEDWIDNEINNLSIRDLDDEDDLKRFIEDNWSTEKEKKVIEIWKDNQLDDDNDDKISKVSGVISRITYDSPSTTKEVIITKEDDTLKKYKIPETHRIIVREGNTINKGDALATLEYSYDMLDELDSKELINIIEDAGEEYEYVEKVVNDRYDGLDAQDIINELYGDTSKMNEDQLYNMLNWYINDSEIENWWKDNEDFGYKKDFTKDAIYNDISLQSEILKKDPSNVLKLAEIFKESFSKENIADEYEFQKLYIKKYIKENKWDDDKDTLKAKALKFLHDTFGLNGTIENEYKDFMWMISASKYNL